MRSGDGEGFDAPIKIKFAIGSISARMTKPTNTAPARHTRAHHIHDHPTGQFTRQQSQFLVSGAAERCQQCQRSVGVVAHQLIERGLIEFTHLG
ncbi:unannotated protein [freshwater metagenome]|uniref:Unannotated protein n=1 Tax=freshwater metagenome TaxID=449393 RepID=A0A6J7KS92_9ZZZZ